MYKLKNKTEGRIEFHSHETKRGTTRCVYSLKNVEVFGSANCVFIIKDDKDTLKIRARDRKAPIILAVKTTVLEGKVIYGFLLLFSHYCITDNEKYTKTITLTDFLSSERSFCSFTYHSNEHWALIYEQKILLYSGEKSQEKDLLRLKTTTNCLCQGILRAFF